MYGTVVVTDCWAVFDTRIADDIAASTPDIIAKESSVIVAVVADASEDVVSVRGRPDQSSVIEVRHNAPSLDFGSLP